MARTDTHRPSKINPQDYRFLGNDYLGSDIELEVIKVHRSMRKQYMETHGIEYARHKHGGTCQCCGASALYVAWYHHVPTDTAIRIGHICADKMSIGDPRAFRTFRKQVKDARQRKAGQAKAKALLSDKNLSLAWDMYNAKTLDEAVELVVEPTFIEKMESRGLKRLHESFERNVMIIRDIVSKMVKYGNLTGPQEKYLSNLVSFVGDYHEKATEKMNEIDNKRQSALPAPHGRKKVKAKVCGIRYNADGFGQSKMLIETTNGWKAWLTIPTVLRRMVNEESELKGKTITVTATWKPSNDDRYFAFGSRPYAYTQDQVDEAVTA